MYIHQWGMELRRSGDYSHLGNNSQWVPKLLLSYGRGFTWASLVAQRLKHLPAMRETWVRSLGREDPLEKETTTHSSILAWRIPWTKESGGLQSMESQRVRKFQSIYQGWKSVALNWGNFSFKTYLHSFLNPATEKNIVLKASWLTTEHNFLFYLNLQNLYC